MKLPYILCCFLTSISINTVAKVSTKDVVLPALTDATHYQKTTLKIVRLLENEHYRDLKLNDNFSEQLFEKYIDILDPGKTFFLKQDIEQFQAYRQSLDNHLKKGDNSAAFSIYSRFRERLRSRLSEVVSMLEDDNFDFDFTKKESISIGDEENWLESTEQAKDLWRKKIKSALLAQKLSGDELTDARQQLLKNYANQLERISKQDSNDVYEIFINSFTELYDPHTSYMSPRVTKNFYINMSLSLEGIGAVLQSSDEYTKVLRVVSGGPASKQGELKASDKIIGVGQGTEPMVNVVGWRLDDVVELIRGKKGTSVKLNVIHGDATSNIPETITIVRDKVKLEDQDAQKASFEVPSKNGNHKIGVISLPAFYLDFEALRNNEPDVKSTTTDVRKLLSELETENVDGIILDLRNNGGGSLSEARDLTDLFIDKGPVVQIRRASSLFSSIERSYRPPQYRGPMIVLINRLSASASEILAGALQDYNRAIIVGSQSFGKGTVQTIKDLDDDEKLKITESKFYRVSGASTQHRGVIPDILMPEVIDTEKVGENTYDSALPWDTISPAPHRPYRRLGNIIKQLDNAHKERVTVDPDFIFINEQSALFDVINTRTTLSLNEQQRIKEKAELENKSLAIENKRRLAKKLTPYNDIESLRSAEKKKQEEAQGKANAIVIDAEEDAILREAGKILSDLIDISNTKLANRR